MRISSLALILAVGGCVDTAAPVTTTQSALLSTDTVTVYDTANDATWLADANLAHRERFTLAACTGAAGEDTSICVNPSGSMTYSAAVNWVAAMNVARYLGRDNWQLPTTPSYDPSCYLHTIGTDGNTFGYQCSTGTLGSLYYTALGLAAPTTTVPMPDNTVGKFSNIQPYAYWSATQNANASTGYFTFSFNTGYQSSNTRRNAMYVLPMFPDPGYNGKPIAGTVYDKATQIYWLADANAAKTPATQFGLPRCDLSTPPVATSVCINSDGSMTWTAANQYVANMRAAGYLGQTGWQLPPIDPSGCAGAYDCKGKANPMGQLYYGPLLGSLAAGTPVVTAPTIDVGPFHDMQPYLYWSCGGDSIAVGCQNPPADNFQWSFSFGNGFLGTDLLQNDLYVVPVLTGAIPPLGVSPDGGLLKFGESTEVAVSLYPAPASDAVVTITASNASGVEFPRQVTVAAGTYFTEIGVRNLNQTTDKLATLHVSHGGNTVDYTVYVETLHIKPPPAGGP